MGVFLTYVGPRGHAFLDRRLYLPQTWAEDRTRRAEAAIPEEVAFQTKPALAWAMLEHAWGLGVPGRWVTADTVYGQDPVLRARLDGVAADVQSWPSCGGRQEENKTRSTLGDPADLIPLSVPEARRLLEVVLPLPAALPPRATPGRSGAGATRLWPGAATPVAAAPALPRHGETVVLD